MRRAQQESLKEKIKRVKLLILDVDGVLTDGRIIYDSEGRQLRLFDAQDGTGILLLAAAGIKTIMVTILPSRAIECRAKDLRVEELYQGVKPKTKVLQQILEKHGIAKEEICYVGDDVVDVGVMRSIGFPVAVKNATRDVKDAACYVTKCTGGRGAVREIAELILTTQGKWRDVLKKEFGIPPRPRKRALLDKRGAITKEDR